MSNSTSPMDVEDVLSSIRRLVSEEAKTAPTGRERTSSAPAEDIHESTENAVQEALSDLGFDEAEDLASAPEIQETPPHVPFRHQAAAAARRASDEQKLVLTDALRVEEQDNFPAQAFSNPDSGTLGKQAEAPPEEPANPRPRRPHLRPVQDGEYAEDFDIPQNPTRPQRFNYTPEDSLFERARRAMEEVREKRDRAETTVSPIEVETGESVASAEMEFAAQEEIQSDLEKESPPREPSNASPFAAVKEGFASRAQSAPSESLSPSSEEEEATINFTEEDSILDEETLREMVSEMVREELQGELGDRITRNVRKLVRREIQRALASREFE